MSQADGTQKRPTVAMVLTSHATLGNTGQPTGAWYSEVAGPYYVFKDAGCAITMVSIKGGSAVIDPASRAAEWQTDATRRMDSRPQDIAALNNTITLAELDTFNVDILFMPGGVGAIWDFPDSIELKRAVESCASSGKQIVTTLCHGAAALVNAQDRNGKSLVQGRKITCITNAEEKTIQLENVVPFLLETRFRELGAIFRGGPEFSDTAHSDGWLITGQNPASAEHAARLALQGFERLSKERAAVA
jgi:putative intracellular protease/amidase